MIPVIKQTHKKKRKEKFQNNSKAVIIRNSVLKMTQTTSHLNGKILATTE